MDEKLAYDCNDYIKRAVRSTISTMVQPKIISTKKDLLLKKKKYLEYMLEYYTKERDKKDVSSLITLPFTLAVNTTKDSLDLVDIMLIDL